MIDRSVRFSDRLFGTIRKMKSFAELFKKYRLRAEFGKLSEFGAALSEKGFICEDSIFSHWQKGTRIPADRKLVLKIIEIFVERKAIKTKEEANEFLASTRFGYMTEEEAEKLELKINKTSKSSVSRFRILSGISFISLFFLGFIFIYLYIHSQFLPNYTNSIHTIPSAVTEPKKLVIGIDATLEPMEYIENEKIVGFDVDLGTNLAKELDAKIEFRNINFDDIFNSLDQRQINMIISAVTITDERQKKYDFSSEYLNAGQVIITKKNNTTIHGVTDLEGKRIATQTGTTNEKEALKHTPDRLVIRYPDFVQATKALTDGNVDALFTDLPNAKGITSRNSNLKIVSAPFTKEYYGIVFLKGDPSVTQVNESLKTLRKKGVISDLEKKWLN
jgi:ABC-type amino acid transport substrate-binding protein